MLAKLGVDFHDVGVRLIAKYLMDNGIEVIYLGYSLPEGIVKAAEEEDVNVIGVSSMQGMHHVKVPQIMRLLKEKELDIPVVCGGIIPAHEAPALKEAGVKEVFGPGTQLSSILETIKKLST